MPTQKEKDLLLIQRFFDNGLSTKEMAQFAKKIKNDDVFAQSVDFYKNSKSELNHEGLARMQHHLHRQKQKQMLLFGGIGIVILIVIVSLVLKMMSA